MLIEAKAANGKLFYIDPARVCVVGPSSKPSVASVVEFGGGVVFNSSEFPNKLAHIINKARHQAHRDQAAVELDRLADMNAGLLDRFEAVALRLAEAEAANEKLRGECEELRERVAAYEHAATAVMRERPGCRCNIEDCEAGQCSQCLLMEATDYMDEAARAAEGGEG